MSRPSHLLPYFHFPFRKNFLVFFLLMNPYRLRPASGCLCNVPPLALFIVAPFAIDRTSNYKLRIAIVFHEHPPKVFPYHADRHQLNAR